MGLNSIFMLVGGLGLFFYGMRLMSDGLKKISGDRLKNILKMVTTYPVVGVLVGALVTCLVQSSSATTVMVVGFVNAGLLVLKQAISVIMGANIGTTFTAWLVSSMSVFKITKYALPTIGIGFALTAFGQSRKTKSWGEVLMGFGMLFLGLDFMKDAFDPLKESAQVKEIFIQFSHNPILGVFVGTLITILLQSSSATIAIVQVLAFNGIITFSAAIPLILGDNIGTTITAQLAAVGSNVNARRAAMSHTLFNVIGVAYMLFFVYTGWFERIVDFIIPGEITPINIMFCIAVAHSSFNVLNAIVFLPFIGLLEKASIKLVPKPKGAIDTGTQYLEKHLLETPTLAMQQARNETVYMLTVACKAVSSAVEGFLDQDIKKLGKVAHYERATDNLQFEITQYLIDLSQKELSEEESEALPVLIHSVNDMERIGDHSENIQELASNRIEEKVVFSEKAVKELNMMWGEVKKMFKDTEDALRTNDSMIAQNIMRREGRINELQVRFKEAHIDRLNRGECQLMSNFIFLDFIDNLEKIADHLTNIGQGVIGKMKWSDYKRGDEYSEKS